METTSRDLLAYIVLKGADALAAESSAELTVGDLTTFDFKVGKYFGAEDFSFGLKLNDDEPSDNDSTANDEVIGGFARWRRVSALVSARGNDKVAPPFRSETEEFELTRYIDSASPILIENCLNSKDFTKLVVVKRARTGDETLAGFMRLVFTKVRIKSVSWDDGDAVKETCKFSFDAVNVKYHRRSVQVKAKEEFRCEWLRQK